jgi:enoyl-CoA hydratase/carnithine racemase
MPRHQIEMSGPVARLVLKNAPLNTLDVPSMQEMTADLRRLTVLPAAERPRALVITSGVAGQFSQGVDPQAVLATDVYGRKQIFVALGDLVEALWFSLIPILADVSGPALAGGAVLATLADFALIDSHAGKICFSEVKVGLPLPLFVQRLIMRKTNPSSWNEVMLLGKNVDAPEAVRIGMANAAYGSQEERAELTTSFLGRITRLPPAALTETLRQSRAAERELLRSFKADLGAFADFLTDDYLGKGLRAVLKGESPKF